MNQSHLNRLVWGLPILALILVLTGCNCNKPKTASLSGAVVLTNDSGDPANDPADYSGVTISLYESVELDTAIVRANTECPGVGFPISQESEFDHREHVALQSVESSSTGEFKLTQITPGVYNLVISKPGWGWRYLLECHVDEGSNTLADVTEDSDNRNSVTLYPEYEIETQDQIQVLKAHHFYKVETDVTLLHDLVMEGGAILHLAPYANLSIIGDLVSETNTNDRMVCISVDRTIPDMDHCFGKIAIQGNVSIIRMSLSYSLTGFQCVGGSVDVSYVRVRKSHSGIVCRESNSVDVSYSVVSDIGQLVTSGANIYSSDGGIDLTSCSGSMVHLCIFVRCNVGVKVREFSDTNVSDSYFANNSIGAEGLVTTAVYEHNHFQDNYSYDIRVYGTCSPMIRKNEFNSVRGVNIGLNTLLAFLNCSPSISSNNFDCQQFAIRIMGNNMIDINATNNYFHTTNLTLLEEIIWDQNDYNPEDISNQIIQNTAYINYIPFLNHKVPDAGIRL